MFRPRRNRWLVILALVLTTPLAALGQQRSQKIDYQRMRRDLDIMETILKKLLATAREEEEAVVIRKGPGGDRREPAQLFPAVSFRRDVEVGSVYLEDFGVIFDVDYRGDRSSGPLLRAQLERELSVLQQQLQLRLWSTSRRTGRRSEEAGTIKGKVTDKESGRPLEKAYVFIDDDYGAVTDARGAFIVANLEPGTYTVRARAPGYKEAVSGKLSVKGGTVSVTLALEVDKTIDRLKSQLVTFLSTYADAIRQISPSEWIMVMVNFPGERFGRFRGEEPLERLEAQVKKRDIDLYRSGKMDLTVFQKRVKFRQLASAEADTDLDIFVEIMKTVFEKRKGEGALSADEVQGFYLNDFGALVTIEARRRFMVFVPDVVFEQSDEGNTMTVFQARKKAERAARSAAQGQKEDETRQALESFKAQVIEVVADFGHTLRRIPRTGWIAVVADLEPKGLFSERRRLVCRVKKRDIDAYNRQNFDLEALTKRVVWREY